MRATRHAGLAIAAWVMTASLFAAPSGATAQQICAADRNGNGDATDPGETAICNEATGSGALCPIQQASCVEDAGGIYSCPLGSQYACRTPVDGGTPACSPHACTPVVGGAVVVEAPLVDDLGASNDGVVDADGNCLGTIEIFSGRAVRCRPAGLNTSFSNCCKDQGKIVKDGMGSSLSSIGTKIAVAKGVWTGMKAAYTAFKAGATASQAAGAGANAIIIGIDPTSIAISLAINVMMDFLLSGCDQLDMEVGMLRGSGMCHEVGTYCASSILGVCVQKAKGHCCFNSKLGRIIQEQGRPHLKSFNALGWGTAKQPYCRGFTPQEFQALDFSRMDLSDYYADIEARAQSDIQIDMEDRIDAYLQTVNP